MVKKSTPEEVRRALDEKLRRSAAFGRAIPICAPRTRTTTDTTPHSDRRPEPEPLFEHSPWS